MEFQSKLREFCIKITHPQGAAVFNIGEYDAVLIAPPTKEDFDAWMKGLLAAIMSAQMDSSSGRLRNGGAEPAPVAATPRRRPDTPQRPKSLPGDLVTITGEGMEGELVQRNIMRKWVSKWGIVRDGQLLIYMKRPGIGDRPETRIVLPGCLVDRYVSKVKDFAFTLIPKEQSMMGDAANLMGLKNEGHLFSVATQDDLDRWMAACNGASKQALKVGQVAKLRVCLVGIGSALREVYEHLYFRSEYSQYLSVVAVVELNSSQREVFCDIRGVPSDARFDNIDDMLRIMRDSVDCVHVMTADALHGLPTVKALKNGLDVLVTKPLAVKVTDCHTMMTLARDTGRLLNVDWCRREDPRILNTAKRYAEGRYGQWQSAVLYNLDTINACPPEFMGRNTPLWYSTTHMADALIHIVQERPVEVRTTAYAHKLPSLDPPIKGYDMLDTEVRFEKGGTAHIITGWHLPSAAHATPISNIRLVCADGYVELTLEKPGLLEVTPERLNEVNPLSLNFTGEVTSGYAITSPGEKLKRFLASRQDGMDARERDAMLSEWNLGFYSTLVCQAAERSLETGDLKTKNAINGTVQGVIWGRPIDLAEFTRDAMVAANQGDAWKGYYEIVEPDPKAELSASDDGGGGYDY